MADYSISNFQRFWAHVRWSDGHALWAGKRKDRNGYGRFDDMSAQKWIWQFWNGPLASGMEMGHTCEFVACVIHSRPVTHSQNVLESRHYNRNKKKCKRNHSNWRTRPDGRRYCHSCMMRRLGYAGL